MTLCLCSLNDFLTNICRQCTHEHTASIAGAGVGGPAPFWRLTAAHDTFCVPLCPLLKFSPAQDRSRSLVSWHCLHWFLCSLKPQPLGHSSSCQICDLVVDTGNFHASATAGEGTDKGVLLQCCWHFVHEDYRGWYLIRDWPSQFQICVYLCKYLKGSNWSADQKYRKIALDCHGKIAKDMERLVSTGNGKSTKWKGQETRVWI